jgi:mono/diheme cytochrome c family protein
VLLLLLAVEGVLMVTFIRWRIALAKGRSIDLSERPRLVTLHHVEFWVIVVVVIAASIMARGIGSVRAPSGGTSASPAAAEISLGGELYAQHCGACHQADGRGVGGQVAGDFVGDPTRLAKSDAQLLSSIAQGVPGTAMPGFSGRLDTKQQQAVLAYIRAKFGQELR